MNSLRSLKSCRSGAAAVEMALVTPLLIIIMFGIFEAGNFFWNQHIVGKAVRDGARFAARRPLTDYPACTPNSSVIAQTRNVTRTGQVSGGTPRIFDWTDDNTVTVTGSCSATTTTGIYRNYPAGAPRVTVSATLTYNSLFGIVGFNTTGFQLRSNAQAAVMGF